MASVEALQPLGDLVGDEGGEDFAEVVDGVLVEGVGGEVGVAVEVFVVEVVIGG